MTRRRTWQGEDDFNYQLGNSGDDLLGLSDSSDWVGLDAARQSRLDALAARPRPRTANDVLKASQEQSLRRSEATTDRSIEEYERVEASEFAIGKQIFAVDESMVASADPMFEESALLASMTSEVDKRVEQAVEESSTSDINPERDFTTQAQVERAKANQTAMRNEAGKPVEQEAASKPIEQEADNRPVEQEAAGKPVEREEATSPADAQSVAGNSAVATSRRRDKFDERNESPVAEWEPEESYDEDFEEDEVSATEESSRVWLSNRRSSLELPQTNNDEHVTHPEFTSQPSRAVQEAENDSEVAPAPSSIATTNVSLCARQTRQTNQHSPDSFADTTQEPYRFSQSESTDLQDRCNSLEYQLAEQRAVIDRLRATCKPVEATALCREPAGLEGDASYQAHPDTESDKSVSNDARQTTTEQGRDAIDDDDDCATVQSQNNCKKRNAPGARRPPEATWLDAATQTGGGTSPPDVDTCCDAATQTTSIKKGTVDQGLMKVDHGAGDIKVDANIDSNASRVIEVAAAAIARATEILATAAQTKKGDTTDEFVDSLARRLVVQCVVRPRRAPVRLLGSEWRSAPAPSEIASDTQSNDEPSLICKNSSSTDEESFEVVKQPAADSRFRHRHSRSDLLRPKHKTRKTLAWWEAAALKSAGLYEYRQSKPSGQGERKPDRERPDAASVRMCRNRDHPVFARGGKGIAETRQAGKSNAQPGDEFAFQTQFVDVVSRFSESARRRTNTVSPGDLLMRNAISESLRERLTDKSALDQIRADVFLKLDKLRQS